MPIERTVIQSGNALVSQVSGVLSGDEMKDHMYWLINNFNSKLKTGYRQLFDTSEMTDVTVDKSDINRISQIMQIYGAHRGKVRTGIVTTNPRGRQMAFAYQTLSRVSDVEVKIYDTVDEALGWLRIEPGDVPHGEKKT